MATSEETTRSKNARRKKRYAEDAEYREEKQAAGGVHNARKRTEINARRRARYATDPDYREKVIAGVRKNRRKATLMKYGMSCRDYEELLAQQGGGCATCDRDFTPPLCVDHCHQTNEVRGLLCAKCNLGLGHYDNDPVLLRNAADYIDRFLARHPELRNRKEKK
jgi:hypothetical protein